MATKTTKLLILLALIASLFVCGCVRPNNLKAPAADYCGLECTQKALEERRERERDMPLLKISPETVDRITKEQHQRELIQAIESTKAK